MDLSKLKGYRTLAFNVLVGALVVLQALGFLELSPEQLEGLALISAGGNFGLRFMTDTKVGSVE